MSRVRAHAIVLALVLVGGATVGCADPVDVLDGIAERYVRLVLAVGRHDANYVDAYYGPPEWAAAAEAAGKRPLAELGREGEALASELRRMSIDPRRDGERIARRTYLHGQLGALIAYCAMLGGHRLSFDREARLLYDFDPPNLTAAHFDRKLVALDRALPGEGSVSERYNAYRARFVIPRDKVDAVFRAAVEEARRRTLPHVELPEGERFTIEYVTDKPWSGYNWYKGDGHSLIQVNVDLPIYIDRALDLAAHEGYPGHHVYNALLERHLARGKGWVEFTVYPLFSPQSLIAEGSANYGIDVAFPGGQRTAFEREVLYPLAGLDPAEAGRYAEVRELVKALSYADNEAARGYLDGRLTADEAKAWLVRYSLATPERAAQRLRFIETYRSYVINYNVGEDLVKRYVEAQGGTAAHPARRWEVFVDLLASPRLPSALAVPEKRRRR